MSRGRVVVERTFGKLKTRWRCLLKELQENISRVPKTILTCCILHNLCLRFDDDIQEDDDDDDGDGHAPPPGLGDPVGRGVRQAIADFM